MSEMPGISEHDQEPAVLDMVDAKQGLSLKGKTMLVPEMGGYTTRALAAAIEGLLDANVRILPTGNGSNITLGKMHSSGRECWPFVQTLADILTGVRRLIAEGASLDDIVLLMPQADGPCRFGQYLTALKIILKEMGFGSVRILSPTAADSYTLGGILTKGEAGALRKVAFNAIVFADVLNRMVWRTRPYEREPGLADKVGEESLEAICEMVKEGAKGRTGAFAPYDDILNQLADIAQDFRNVINPKSPRKPLVLVVGEIYLRAHSHSNQDLVKKLEALGCEAVVSSMAEWLNYLTHEKVYEGRRKFWENLALNGLFKKIEPQNVKELVKYLGTLLYQYWRMDAAYDAVSALGIQRDHRIGHLFRNLDGLYHRDLVGEAVLSIASGVTAEKERLNGLVNVYPPGCMPSNNARIVLRRHYEKLAKRTGILFPYVDVPCGDIEQLTRDEELSLFADKASRYMERRMRTQGACAKEL